MVAKRLDQHIDYNKLADPLQSAYRVGHSTETALVKVQADITSMLDDGGMVVLVMLDLSSAFDTLDHDIMLDRLEHMFGIQGQALGWIRSYFQGRTQCVNVDGSKSGCVELHFAVPQGSILGPKKYTYYSKPIGNIIKHHNMDYMIYADDSQIYIVIRPSTIYVTIGRVEQLVSEIQKWMEENMLKLNEDKTEVLLIAPPRKQHYLNNITFTFGSSTITPSQKIKNLGCWWNATFTMDTQVDYIVRICNFQLRKINRIKKYLTPAAVKTLVQSLVISRLDYGNAMFAGAQDYLIKKLQRVQNTAARVITGLGKYDHITMTLYELHWLPVEKRIQFKILLLTFKALNGLAPSYISDLLVLFSQPRHLRSRGQSHLAPPHTKRGYGDRCFTVVAPQLWNEIPDSVKFVANVGAFKCQLKTHLFRIAYNC